MAWLAFAASVALAQILTNIDNFVVLLAIAAPVGLGRAVSAYGAAQVIVLAGALILASGMSGLPASWVGFLGVVPITLGLWTLFGFEGEADDPAVGSSASVFAVTAMFLGLSIDSLTVQTALLADSTTYYKTAALVGAGGAILAMVLAAWTLTGTVDRYTGVASRLERLRPYVMILAGIYVLANTLTDAVA